MGHFSIRCPYTGGYLDFLSEMGSWRKLQCWQNGKQQILIFFLDFLGKKTLFFEITSPIIHQSLNILLSQGHSAIFSFT